MDDYILADIADAARKAARRNRGLTVSFVEANQTKEFFIDDEPLLMALKGERTVTMRPAAMEEDRPALVKMVKNVEARLKIKAGLAKLAIRKLEHRWRR